MFYHPDPEVCCEVARACYAGGLRVIEFTNRGPGAHEAFQALRAFANRELPGMVLGVGSIVDAGTTSLFLQLGADFIVSPILNPDMARVCNRRKVLWSPGCSTLSEISQAEELGAELVKIFPGDILGPTFVKAIKGPCPWTSIIVTGGVSPTRESLQAWFSAGVTCAGMGSKLITPELLKARDYDGLREQVRELVAIVAELRGR